MNEVKIITAFTPAEQEAHITVEDDAAIYEGIVGSDGVLNIGEKLRYEIISNNKIKIYDGVFEVGGHFARIPYGGFVEATITNGSGGKKRNDIIIAKLVKNSVSGDSITIEVKKGVESAGTPRDPSLIKENIYTGGQTREFPLYRVRLDGITISKVEPLFTSKIISLRDIGNIKEEKINKLKLDENILNNNLNKLGTIRFAGENPRDLNYTMIKIKTPSLNSTSNLRNDKGIKPVFYFGWMQQDSGYTSYMLPYKNVSIDCIDTNYIYYKNPSEINWNEYTLYIFVAYYD